MFLSLADRDKPAGMVVARRFAELGFGIVATAGTAEALEGEGLIAEAVIGRITDGDGADGIDAVELLNSGKIDLVVNTPRGQGRARRRRPHPPHRHRPRHPVRHHGGRRSRRLRRHRRVVPSSEPEVRSLQEYHRDGQLRLEV